ncbi:hypothetical protein [Thalassospira mesophila]|uniref:hypothetical protein n=1 Tax=Thalassospira mesophila TaxID=1293891 RepID=UPI00117CD17D|nr:hypothetical protein [Thalassospira mesophila]
MRTKRTLTHIFYATIIGTGVAIFSVGLWFNTVETCNDNAICYIFKKNEWETIFAGFLGLAGGVIAYRGATSGTLESYRRESIRFIHSIIFFTDQITKRGPSIFVVGSQEVGTSASDHMKKLAKDMQDKLPDIPTIVFSSDANEAYFAVKRIISTIANNGVDTKFEIVEKLDKAIVELTKALEKNGP